MIQNTFTPFALKNLMTHFIGLWLLIRISCGPNYAQSYGLKVSTSIIKITETHKLLEKLYLLYVCRSILFDRQELVRFRCNITQDFVQHCNTEYNATRSSDIGSLIRKCHWTWSWLENKYSSWLYPITSSIIKFKVNFLRKYATIFWTKSINKREVRFRKT